MASVAPAPRERLPLLIQLWVGRLLSPLLVPLCVALIRWGFRWRVENLAETRAAYARLRRQSSDPLLICANHLTMLDSAVIAYALGSAGWYLAHPSSLPWNTPEQENFASTWWKRVLVYVLKCVPVKRGGDRRAVGETLNKIVYLLERGEVGLVFPEGGRSRSGRLEAEAATYGVGRIVKALPGCQVLCVYVRGTVQETWSSRPATGESFQVALEHFEPKTDHKGMRGNIDILRQILSRLQAMEKNHFDGR